MIVLFSNYYVRVVFSCMFMYHRKSYITAICTQMSFHKIKNCGQTVDITKMLASCFKSAPQKTSKTLNNSGKQRFVKNLLSSELFNHQNFH